MADAIVGLFTSEGHATDAVRALRAANFPADGIGIIAPDTARADTAGGLHLVHDANTPVDATLSHEGTAAGGILGGTIGGLLAATGALVIPGVGPFIAGGILATVIAGGAIGAVSGALLGLGVAKEDAAYYEAQVHGGRTLVSVVAAGREVEAAAILTEHGAELERSVSSS